MEPDWELIRGSQNQEKQGEGLSVVLANISQPDLGFWYFRFNFTSLYLIGSFIGFRDRKNRMKEKIDSIALDGLRKDSL